MVTYPIHVKRDAYRGANPKRRFKALETNRIAFELEECINPQLKAQTEPVKEYSYYEIANATGYSVTVVRDLCFCIDCGHHGFTAIKHGMSYEEAMASLGF